MKKQFLVLSLLCMFSLSAQGLDQYLIAQGYNFLQGFPEMEPYMTDAQKKQFNARLTSNPFIRNVLEIGLNGGHSAENFFTNCRGLKKLVSFDICHHPYTSVAANYFSNSYPYAHRFEAVWGDSIETVPAYLKKHPELKFDLIYVDGSHSYHHCRNDILNCRDAAHSYTIVWVDDCNMPAIESVIEDLQREGVIELLNVNHSQDRRGDRHWAEIRYRN